MAGSAEGWAEAGITAGLLAPPSLGNPVSPIRLGAPWGQGLSLPHQDKDSLGTEWWEGWPCQSGLCTASTMLWFKAAVPNLFWHQGLVSWKTIFPRTGGWGGWFRTNMSDGERQMKLRLLARPWLTSCCVAQLRGGGATGGVRDPWFKGLAAGRLFLLKPSFLKTVLEKPNIFIFPSSLPL